MQRLSVGFWVVGIIGLLLGLTWVSARVLFHERYEVVDERQARSIQALMERRSSTRVSVRLIERALVRDQRVSFEVCTRADMSAAPFRNALHFVVWRPSRVKVVLRVPLDQRVQAGVLRSDAWSCLFLGEGTIEQSGVYAIDAVWPKTIPPKAVLQAEVVGRIAAWVPVVWQDRVGLWILFLSGCLIVVGTWVWRRGPALSSESTAHALAMWLWLCGAVAVVLLLTLVVPELTWNLPLSGLLNGVFLALGELALVLTALYFFPIGERRQHLGLVAPAWPVWKTLLVVISSVAFLVVSAKGFLRLIPSTEVAPLQRFVALPSGLISFTALALLVPWIEELFFRGAVYGMFDRGHTARAYVLTAMLFILLHLRQVWGGWGGFVAIAWVGFYLTGLRAVSRSTTLTAWVHLGYNATLSADMLLST